MNYTIYEIASGKIIKTISCPPELVDMQYDSKTHAALEGSFDDSSYYVDEGVQIGMPEKPSQYHAFDYITKQWVDPRTSESEWTLVRAERDRRLVACDWTQLPDVPLETKEKWAEYRQALRDITLQPDPFNIVWPAQP